MKLPESTLLRLQFLCRVVEKETKHLQATCSRLFTPALTLNFVTQLDNHPDTAERVEAFVSRFGRLQDTLGDKLLPALLAALGERVASAADNLDRAERLGLIASADDWFAMRALRNQMVHEYVEDPAVLFAALQAGHLFTATLAQATNSMVAEVVSHGWLQA